jgi:hypothetical protein
MASTVSAEAVRRLVASYPQVSTGTVTEVLEQADRTITKLLGQPDQAAAEDLARLRLDIRTHRYA